MPTTQIVSVSSTVRYELTAPDPAVLTVLNLGPDLCYYGSVSVTSGSNEGSLAAAASLPFNPGKFFISAGTSRLQVLTPSPAEQLRRYDRDFSQTGIYGSPGAQPPTTVGAITANRLYGLRFVPSRSMTILSGAFALTTVSASDDAVNIGIYSATGTGPLICESGSTVGKLITATGRRVLTMLAPGSLIAGQPYYSIMVAAAAGTAAQVGMTSVNNAAACDLFGVADGTAVASPHLEAGFFANGSLTLPATLPTLAAVPTLPVVAWREF